MKSLKWNKYIELIYIKIYIPFIALFLFLLTFGNNILFVLFKIYSFRVCYQSSIIFIKKTFEYSPMIYLCGNVLLIKKKKINTK